MIQSAVIDVRSQRLFRLSEIPYEVATFAAVYITEWECCLERPCGKGVSNNSMSAWRQKLDLIQKGLMNLTEKITHTLDFVPFV